MTTKHIPLLSSLLSALLLLPGLSGCQGRTNVDEPSVTPTTSDDEYTVLDEPIVLEFLVNAPRKVDPMGVAGTRAVGDLDRTYTKTDKDKATVNTPKREQGEYHTGDEDYDDILWRKDLFMTDWIRTLSIPELRPTDYKVEGLIGLPSQDLYDIHHGKDISEADKANVPAKVTLTLYALPTKGVLTFIANGKRNPNSPRTSGDVLTDLSLDNPYLLSSDGEYILNDWVKEPLGNDELSVNSSGRVFETSYLPMFARLYNVAKDPGSRGILASETPGGTAVPTKSVYLERAVSLVTVGWDRPIVFNNETYKQDIVFSSFVEDVEFGYFPNITSVVPSNWSGVQEKMKEYQLPYVRVKEDFTYAPAYWHFLLNRKFTWKSESSANMGIHLRTGTSTFFTPENFPTDVKWQSSIVVFMTKFDKQTEKILERRYKYFDLPYGEKNSKTGILEVHRNTWYKLHIKFEQTPEGPVPYIVSAWDDVEIETEL